MFRHILCNTLLLVAFSFERVWTGDRTIVMTQASSFYPTNTALAFCCLVFDAYKQLCAYFHLRQAVKQFSYSDFLELYPDLVFFEEQVARIRSLLFLSRYGTMPEQILGRLMLVKSSLSYPYDQVAYRCARKLYKLSFDKEGRFVWLEDDPAARAYKKFFKKVPQNYKNIIRGHKAYQSHIEFAYQDNLTAQVNNVYNQRLLDVIYAGIQRNYPRLRVLCRQGYDVLIEKLYEYYMQEDKLYDDNTLIRLVHYDVAIVLALHCSDSKNDTLTQELADKILMLILFSVESKSNAYEDHLKTLYDLLVQRVNLNQNSLKNDKY